MGIKGKVKLRLSTHEKTKKYGKFPYWAIQTFFY